jgi:hypothetical protein
MRLQFGLGAESGIGFGRVSCRKQNGKAAPRQFTFAR